MKTKLELPDERLEELRDTGDWTDDEGEVRELASLDFAKTKPFGSLPPELQTELLSLRGTAAPTAKKKAS